MLRELYRRKSSNESLLGYVNCIEVPGRPVSSDPEEAVFLPVESTLSAHHILMLDKIQQCMQTPYGRLMIFMPPGTAKSTYASVVAPTWYMGKNPGSRIILASYASDLARRHGRKARQIVRSEQFRRIFGCTISHDSSAADEWAITNGSEYMGAGLLSGITGNRANGLLIDDPVKGREEAESEVIRAKVRQEYEDSALTRILPGAWVIIIQTRWHDEDLAGSILPESYDGESGPVLCRDGQTWEILNLPAQCEREPDPLGRKVGEYIWPEYFTERHFKIFQQNPRTWASLYQQRPSPGDGSYFKREWFRYYDALPEQMNTYITVDGAITEDDGDFTEMGVWGIDHLRNGYALDWDYCQATPADWIERLIDRILIYKPLMMVFEGSNIEKSVIPFLRIRMRERNVFCPIHVLPNVGDKQMKCQSFRGRQEMGVVYWPRKEWAERVISQLLKFPAGKHDDAVDVCGNFGRYLDHIFEPGVPVPKPPTLAQAWKQPINLTELMQ